MDESRHDSPPRWVIVVRRNKRQVYEDLRQAFEGDRLVEVIKDRRQRERRRQGRRVDIQRRQQQRRAPLPPAEQAFGRHAGFVVVVKD